MKPWKWRQSGRSQHRRWVRLRNDSPLRRMDTRLKLLLSLVLTAAIMLPWPHILGFGLLLLGLLAYARVLGEAASQLWRLGWFLALLLIIDWIVIGPMFAMLIAMRVLLVVSLSALLLGTTTAEEFRQGLRGLGLPYRSAFVLGLAFEAVPLVVNEWNAIREAQQARGAWLGRRTWREWPEAVKDSLALAVPAVVLTARRAWNLTEAAHARGLDSPYKPSVPRLAVSQRDAFVLTVCVGITLTLALLI